MNKSETKEKKILTDELDLPEYTEDMDSLKGTLFSTIVFVGGGIIIFIVLLFYFYMTRI